jgi:hypothetical protein
VQMTLVHPSVSTLCKLRNITLRFAMVETPLFVMKRREENKHSERICSGDNN